MLNEDRYVMHLPLTVQPSLGEKGGILIFSGSMPCTRIRGTSIIAPVLLTLLELDINFYSKFGSKN